jgi:hypothetical protein
MAVNVLPVNYPVARFPTKQQAWEATKDRPYVQVIYIGWFAAQFWGVPGRGWYVALPNRNGGPRRFASAEELATWRPPSRTTNS